jgi:hypothetical protein
MVPVSLILIEYSSFAVLISKDLTSRLFLKDVVELREKKGTNSITPCHFINTRF